MIDQSELLGNFTMQGYIRGVTSVDMSVWLMICQTICGYICLTLIFSAGLSTSVLVKSASVRWCSNIILIQKHHWQQLTHHPKMIQTSSSQRCTHTWWTMRVTLCASASPEATQVASFRFQAIHYLPALCQLCGVYDLMRYLTYDDSLWPAVTCLHNSDWECVTF